MQSSEKNIIAGQELYLLVLLAVVATLWGYAFGVSDHLEHLPILYRLLDGDYLLRDDFVNANTGGYNPRLLLFYALSPLARLLGVELLYLLGALACNFFIVRASALVGKLLWGSWSGAGIGAAAMVMGLSLSGWGEMPYLRVNMFIPSAVATAVVLHGLYYMLRGWWWRMAIVLGLGAVAHPLVCPVSGGLLWLVGFGAMIKANKWAWRAYLAFFGAGLLWLGIVGAIILPYMLQNWLAARIDGALFVEIYAHFRNPHHFLPSFFMNEGETALAWQWSGCLVWLILYNFVHLRSYERGYFWQILAVVGLVLVLLPLGAWGVEVERSRFWAMLQVFRFLFLYKWLIAFLLGGFLFAELGRLWRAEMGLFFPVFLLWIPLFMQPYWLFWALVPYFLMRLLQQGQMLWLAGLLQAVFAGLAWRNMADVPQIYLLGGLLWLALGGSKWGLVGRGLVVLAFVGHWLAVPLENGAETVRRACSHQYNLAQIQSNMQGVAAYLRENTLDTALIYAPPSSSELRLTARRALVVDFKTLPFDDGALVAWRERLFDCYGWTDKLGFEAQRWVFVPNYEYAPIDKQLEKARRYGAQYLLLYAKSDAGGRELLYSDAHYKLVGVGE